MKNRIVLSAALWMALVGCTTVRTVDSTGVSGTYYRITAVDGTQSYGSDLVRTPDSILWTNAAGHRRALAASKVAAVERVPQPTDRRHWSRSFAEINTRARQRQARVVLADGTSYHAGRLQVARDTTAWIDPDTGALYRTATSSIAAVRFRDGKRGTLRGLAVGAGVGALSGIILGIASGNDPPDEWFSMTAGEKAVMAGLGLGVLGVPVGAILGSGSKREYRFSRATLPDAPPQALPAAPAISSPPGGRAPETERPPVRSSRRAGAPWAVSAIGAGAVGGAAFGLEHAMEASGFGEPSGCFLFCGSGDETRHPHSAASPAWLIDVHRDVWPHGKIGFLVSHAGGETFGYDGSAYLFISQTVTTYAPVFSLQASPALRLGLGPALYRVGTQRTDEPEGAVRRQTRLGLVADLALVFPTHTRFYLDLRAQYRHLGAVEVGPFEEHHSDHQFFFPASRVGFSHGFIGAGLGVRL